MDFAQTRQTRAQLPDVAGFWTNHVFLRSLNSNLRLLFEFAQPPSGTARPPAGAARALYVVVHRGRVPGGRGAAAARAAAELRLEVVSLSSSELLARGRGRGCTRRPRGGVVGLVRVGIRGLRRVS